MKKSVFAMCSVLMIFVFVLIFYTIYGREIRQTELNNAMNASMREAMELLLVEEGGPESEKEWKAMFAHSVAVQIESNSTLTVNVIESDMEKGYLKAEAILTWKHPTGTTGQISEVMDIMLEEYVEESSD